MKAITIQSINLHTALLPYLAPFETSFGADDRARLDTAGVPSTAKPEVLSPRRWH